MRHAVTKSRPKGILEAFTTLARLYPKTSAAIAFEVGVLASSLVNAARRRRASFAKIVDVVPILGTHPHKHKISNKTSKAKPAKARTRSAKSKPRKSATKPAADTSTPAQAEAA